MNRQMLFVVALCLSLGVAGCSSCCPEPQKIRATRISGNAYALTSVPDTASSTPSVPDTMYLSSVPDTGMVSWLPDTIIFTK